MFDITTYLDAMIVDSQTVENMTGLANNNFVDWIKTATLAVTSGMPLTGGANPTVTNSDYQTYLDMAEGYSFSRASAGESVDEIGVIRWLTISQTLAVNAASLPVTLK